MKYLAKSQNGKMVHLGEDLKRGKWFYVTDKTAEVVATLTIGDYITFVSEPRGGAFYVTFLAKGTVTVPEQPKEVKTDAKPMATPVTTSTPRPPFQSNYTKPTYQKSDMSKDDWAEKEVRDFKGRCIVYASSILKDGGFLLNNDNANDYFSRLFAVADRLREYIYSK